MKKILTSILALLAVLLLQSPGQVSAEIESGFDMYGTRIDLPKAKVGQTEERFLLNEKWTDFKSRKDVPLNKEWSINFSDIATHDKIDAIVIERNSQYVPVTITLDNSNLVKVKPATSFSGNASYTLKILLANGKKYKMDFKTLAESRLADIEPNDIYVQASEMYLNETIKGGITKGDVDFYRVEVPYYGTMNTSLKGYSGENLEIGIYGETGNALAKKSNLTQGTITAGLMPGTYYIVVKGFYGSEISEYDLTTDFVQSELTDFDGSYNYIEAPVVNLNTSFTGHVGYNLDSKRSDYQDFFKVEVPQNGTLSVDLTGYSGSTLNLEIFGETGPNSNAMKSKFNITQGTLSAGLQKGTYYIRITPFYTSSYSPYKLGVNFEASALKDDNGVSNYIQASQVALNEKFTGHVGYSIDNNVGNYTDFFKVVLTEKGMLNLSLTAYNGSGMDLMLYGETGTNSNAIAYKFNSSASTISKSLPAGTYYIGIRAFSYNGYSPYELDVRFQKE